MVLFHNFRDILQCLSKTTNLSLPAYKPNNLQIQYSDDDVIKHVQILYNGPEPILPFADSDVFYSTITQSRRLTATKGDCKCVYEVKFDVEGSNFNFKAGDTIGIVPHNIEADVKFMISHLDLMTKADKSYSLSVETAVKGGKIPVHVPVKSTLRYIFTHCLDLRSVLKKLFLLALSKHTKDENERKILEYLCSKEGSIAYTTHILNKGLCILDIFSIFTSCKPPVELLLAHLPRLLPRPYSIVNTGLKDNKTLTICFSVMTINDRKGLTTGWLENIILQDTLENQIENLSLSNESSKKKVPTYLRKNMSNFSLPSSLEKPLILIGPGTGVAPFIGFLEERELKKSSPELILGDTWLFFGCRNPELDFIYEKELKGYLCRGILTKLCTAYSRIDNTETKYIQDAITQNAKEVITLINNGAIIYICGDSKTMAAQVKDVLMKSFVEHENISVEEASLKITELQKEKRYLVDAWS